MGLGRIDFAFLNRWTYTDDNLIGATKNTSFRSAATLPHPASAASSTDTATIYLDPINGFDGNSGHTLALAKQSFTAAWNALTALRPWMHIQSNTGETDLTIIDDIAVTNTNPNAKGIQAHPGTIAYMNLSMEGGGNPYWEGAAGVITLNGLFLTQSGFQGGAFVGLRAVSYCTIRTDYGGLGLTMVATPPVVASCVIEALSPINESSRNMIGIGAAANGTTDITQVVIWNSSNSPLVTGIAIADTIYDIENTFTNVTFVRCSTGISSDDTSASSATNVDSCIFYRTSGLDIEMAATGLGNIVANSSLGSTTKVNAFVDLTTAGGNIYGKNPLFLDQANGDFRLMHVARSINGVYFPLTSPCATTGSGGASMGALLATYTQAVLTSDYFTLFEFDDSVGWDFIEMTKLRANFQQFKSIRGINRQTWDSIQTALKLNLPDGYWTGLAWSSFILRMLQGQTHMFFWPDGATGIASFPNVDNPVINQVEGRRYTLTVDNPMDVEEKLYEGFTARLAWSGSGSENYFEIIEHTKDTFLIEIVRGDDPGAAVDLEVSGYIAYFCCYLDMESVLVKSEYAGEDETNGKFTPWSTGSKEVSEFHSREIRLIQAFEPREDLT